MSLNYDTVIVGGPAGCSAAITLAERGLRVALLEAKTYPHHKVCGEFLSPECHRLLAVLGILPALNALQPIVIDLARIIAADGTTWEGCFPGPALGISRRALDALLAAHARSLGVEVYEATTATEICGTLREGFTIEARMPSGRAQFQARAVIAAYGKRASLDRSLKRNFLNKPQPFVAFKAHFSGPPLPRRIDLFAFPGGYCGMSEIEGGAVNVCFLAHQSLLAKAGNCVDDLLTWMQTQNPQLRAWLSAAEPISDRWLSIGQIPFVKKDTVVDDILMVGDAAGLIVPLAGDGIAMALYSGRMAAEHTAAFLTREVSADQLGKNYTRQWHHEFDRRLLLGRGLQIFMLRPGLLSFGLRLMLRLPQLGKYLVTHTRGYYEG